MATKSPGALLSLSSPGAGNKKPEATSTPLPLTTSRPTPSGRLIRQRTGSTCPHTRSPSPATCAPRERRPVANHARFARKGLYPSGYGWPPRDLGLL